MMVAIAWMAAGGGTCHAERDSTELATEWKFVQGDAGLAATTGTWEEVTIPHTWNALDAERGKVGNPTLPDGYYRGACWYARTLDIPASWKGKRVFIRFEAASMVAKTYLNGQLLGEHRGAFTAFCYELTGGLKYGAENELRVQVDNSHQEDVPPLAGDFNIDGGIYRPVHLIVTDPVCITPLYFGSPGVFLTEKAVSAEAATVEVKTLVSNGEEGRATVTVSARITDAAGESVASLSSDGEIEAGGTNAITETITVPHPTLWQGRTNPYLYTATIDVLRDGQVVDEVTQPLGLRTFALSAENGFQLNGVKYPIHGVDRHQDMRDKGWAISPEDHERDAKIMLEMGVTAIRLAHYPQSEFFHDLCDHNGILLWNEVSLVDMIRDTPEFGANAEQQLRELILQRYNHPCVAFWGLFNELGNKPGPAPDALLKRLKGVVNELDQTRLIVAASDKQNRSYNLIPDWTCFNGYPGWYGKGVAQDMGAFIDQRAQEIGKPIGISEYGAGGNPEQHQEGPPQKVDNKGQFHPEEYQSYVHEIDWGQIQNNPKVWGSFIWVMFDFSSAIRNEGAKPGVNDKGLVTQDRKIKKDAFYFYKANWTTAPMVYIASRRMTPRKMATTEVKVYTNCGEVSLTVNGQAIGTAKPDAVHVCRWENVTLQPGDNQIAVAATGGGAGDNCDWVLQP